MNRSYLLLLLFSTSITTVFCMNNHQIHYLPKTQYNTLYKVLRQYGAMAKNKDFHNKGTKAEERKKLNQLMGLYKKIGSVVNTSENKFNLFDIEQTDLVSLKKWFVSLDIVFQSCAPKN